MSLYDYKVDGVTYTQVDNPSGGCKGCIAFSNNELCKRLSHDCALKLWVLSEEDNLQDYTQNNTEKYSGEVQKKSNNIRVGNKVQWCGESGTVIEVTDDRFIVEWRDGCSTESIKYHEDYGVTLLPDEQDNLVKEYVHKIQDKYPEEEQEPKKYNHYFKDVSNLKYIDIYRVLDLWDVTNPCLQHAAKKIIAAGNRGHKDVTKDVQEAIDSLERWKQMQVENKGFNDKQEMEKL